MSLSKEPTPSWLDRIIDTLAEELQNLEALLTDGPKSLGWLYPIRGVYHFFTHQALWRPLWAKMSGVATLSAAVTSSLFFLTYLPQVTLLSITHGPRAAPFSAAVLVLSESATITNFIAQHTILENSLTDLFDRSLASAGCPALLANGHRLSEEEKARKAAAAHPHIDPLLQKLGQVVHKPLPRFTIESIVRPLVYMPLTMIPTVGTFIYIATQGRKVGPVYHDRYFQLKGWDMKKRGTFVQGCLPTYSSFGAMAYALEMIPFASLVFAYTNAVGAGLWAADIEQAREPKLVS